MRPCSSCSSAASCVVVASSIGALYAHPSPSLPSDLPARCAGTPSALFPCWLAVDEFFPLLLLPWLCFWRRSGTMSPLRQRKASDVSDSGGGDSRSVSAARFVTSGGSTVSLATHSGTERAVSVGKSYRRSAPSMVLEGTFARANAAGPAFSPNTTYREIIVEDDTPVSSNGHDDHDDGGGATASARSVTKAANGTNGVPVTKSAARSPTAAAPVEDMSWLQVRPWSESGSGSANGGSATPSSSPSAPPSAAPEGSMSPVRVQGGAAGSTVSGGSSSGGAGNPPRRPPLRPGVAAPSS